MTQKKLRKLRISGFRGIRYNLSIDFTNRYENIIIFGPNAKGKSSISDAFEWFFTGDVKELTKEGCSRYDYRHRLLSNDQETNVTIEFSDTICNSEFVLNSSKRQTYSNTSEDFTRYLDISKHELLILRHKDLKQFVDETKGEKRKEIAQLIGMEGWEKIRNEMGAVGSRLSSLLIQKSKVLDDRKGEVVKLIKSDNFSTEKCWEYAEEQAKVLGIVKKVSCINDLYFVDEKAKEKIRNDDRSGMLAELDAAERILISVKENTIDFSYFDDFETQYNLISSNPKKILCVQLDKLFSEALSLLNSGNWEVNLCPLCGLDICKDELLNHINEHIDDNKDILKEIIEFENLRGKTKNEIKKISDVVSNINTLKLSNIDDINQVKDQAIRLSQVIGNAKEIIEQQLKYSLSVSLKELNIPDEVDTLLIQSNVLLNLVSDKKEALSPTKEETERIEAFQNLSALITHLTRIHEMEKELDPLKKQCTSITTFNNAFQQLRRDTMGGVLIAISENVSKYFLALHYNEGFDDIQLKFLPEEDGVEFHVYYKGEEITPPRKFLSESYLNGLGVCLFLATVQAFNKENGFVVLDDIVNSFDAEHRADLARLLVNELEGNQLIVLTHDSIWFDVFRRLARQGWQYKRITRWSYENGVEIEQSKSDLLAECREAIELSKVEVAAPRVRTYIENRLKSLLLKLGGRVRFREGTANDERAAGELLSELKKYLHEGGFFNFANEKPFNELEASTFIANYGSHDRPPAPVGLVIGDVNFALDRILELESVFICPTCEKKIWNITDRNYKMQCKCGNYSL